MIREEMRKRISRRKSEFDRRAFADLGAYDVIGRELAAMIQRGEIKRVGRGRYRSVKSGSDSPTFGNAEEYLNEHVRKSKRLVFLRKDLDAPVSYDAAGRAIKRLVQRGTLVPLARGVYAKARKSSITGEPVPAGSPERVLLEAANQLGLKIREGASRRAYNEGRSTQVPTGRRVVVEGKPRVSKLQIGNGVYEFVRA